MYILAIPFRKVKGWIDAVRGWEFWSDPKWRRSALLSVAMWLIGTKVIFHYAHWGPGWAVIIGVGLFADCLTWSLKKAIVWVKRSTKTPVSFGKNAIIWLVFFGFNFGLTVFLNTAGDLSTQHTRWAMIPFGVAINPTRYWIDRDVVFGEMSLPEFGRLVRDRTQREARNACHYIYGWTRLPFQ